MQRSTIVVASLALAASGFGATSAEAQEEYRHGHIRHAEAGATLQRATEASAEEAIPNLPFLPGDRVWTDAGGRVEFQFPEGTVVRLDRGSKLDYSDHDESRDERVVLRLWSGSLILRARAPESAIFEIETPGGLVEAMGPAVVRIDIEGGETQLSVYDGEASLDTGRDRVVLAAGERTWARWGDGPAEPTPFDRYAQDEFGLWDGDLESREAWAANSGRYLPRELEPYAPVFETHGTWAYEEPMGYVWQPRVTVGWTPYSNGRWIWTAYGWTWVPYEPWGWVPHHYGRWGFSASLGWYWRPGRVWSGGWVSWGIGGGYVGWCALGWHNRPVVSWPHRGGWRDHGGRRYPRGHAVPRGSVLPERAWSVVRRGDLGRRGGYAQRRVDPGSVGTLRVAESIVERPDRAARAFTRATAVPRAARSRPRPGAASRAARGASPLPLGTTVGSSARSRSGASRGALSQGTPAARRSGQASPRSGAPSGRGASSAARGGNPPWVGSSRSSASGSVAPPATTPRGGAAASRRPRSTTPQGAGVSSSPRSRPRESGSLDRSSSGSRTGASSRSRSAPRSSGAASRSRGSAPPSSGSVSRSRSGARSGGAASRSRGSAPRSSGSVSRSRSGARSSGAASRSRGSAPRSSGTSRSRSGSRSSGAASRSRGSAPRSSGTSRSRGSTSRSSGRSGARSRGGSRRQ